MDLYIHRVDDCLIWRGGIDGRGNPRFAPSSRSTVSPRRILYEERHGSLPTNLHAGCGNKLCVNPEHAWTERNGSLEGRFWAKVKKGPGCWEWTGARGPRGYGIFNLGGGTTQSAHRWIYLHLNPDTDQGLEVHHMCDNPGCVNPGHLQAVTHRTNSLLSSSPAAVNAAKTHCKRGHPLSGSNLARLRNGTRRCRRCHRERQAGYRGGKKLVAKNKREPQ